MNNSHPKSFLSGKLVIYQLVCKEILIQQVPHPNHIGDFFLFFSISEPLITNQRFKSF